MQNSCGIPRLTCSRSRSPSFARNVSSGAEHRSSCPSTFLIDRTRCIMKLSNFLLDEWLNQRHKFPIQYDLASSTGPEWTLNKLLERVDAESRDAVFNAKMDYSDARGFRGLRE